MIHSADSKLTHFVVEDGSLAVSFKETQTVKDGVECDIYSFDNNTSIDLAIVRVAKANKTPLQRILLGTKTIEGYVEGTGALVVMSGDERHTYDFGPGKPNTQVIVGIGDIMQWYADNDDNLVFYEICEPPYEDGRFENIED